MSAPPSISTDIRGLTLKAPLLSQCILSGLKEVENRSWIIHPGWYAIHTGVGKPDSATYDKITRILGDARSGIEVRESVSNAPQGAIAGLAYISHALPLAEMKGNPWASGPYCHVISQVAFLNKPIPRKGQLGQWKLSEAERAAIDAQLPGLEFKDTGHDAAYPSNQVALRDAREQELAARRAQKRKRE
tara:strand:- start:589 stop:1155 length:567 start_codon:yes stop_codon:yes gene_type:complete